MELEEKQDVFRSLQDTAELLSLENHPAKQTVEVCDLRTCKGQVLRGDCSWKYSNQRLCSAEGSGGKCLGSFVLGFLPFHPSPQKTADSFDGLCTILWETGLNPDFMGKWLGPHSFQITIQTGPAREGVFMLGFAGRSSSCSWVWKRPFCVTLSTKSSWIKTSFLLMQLPIKYFHYLLYLLYHEQRCPWKRALHMYFGSINLMPCSLCLVVAGLQCCCPVPVAVDEAAVLVCWAACERKHCLLSGIWALCSSVCMFMCDCVCVYCRWWEEYSFLFWQEILCVCIHRGGQK